MWRIIPIALLLVAQAAAAKCIDARYEITGRVVDVSGAAVAGAEVLASWQELIATRQQSATSATDGSFTVVVIYTPFSGSSSQGFDLCERKLTRINVTGSKPGFVPSVLELKPSSQNLEVTLVLKKQPVGNSDG
jgi:hypothetical protein